MIQLLLGLAYGFADVVRAVAGVLLARRRVPYRASGVVRAPIAAVWDLVTRHDVTYHAANTQVSLHPIEGQQEVYLARVRQGRKELPEVAFRFERREPPHRLDARYIKDLSAGARSLGTDDVVSIVLAAEAPDRTRITYTRELTHDTFATRITAPMGTRAALALATAEAEREAGLPARRTPLWHQLIWTTLAFLSFAWLLDWRLAIAVMGIIAVHEAGHALFLWRYGLGVQFVSFVPFLGGVAAPKRYYDSEWQRGIVALTGVGVSLPITFALIWLAEATNSPNLAAIAILAVIINAVNLIPFPALDGSVVVSMLLAKLHDKLNLAFMIVMFGLFVALGIVLNNPLVWAAIALSFISVVQAASLRSDDYLIKMTRLQSLALLALYLALIAGHVVAFRWSTVTTARAEGALITDCIREARSRPDPAKAVKTCQDQNRLWLLADK